MTDLDRTIAENLESVRVRIDAACKRCGRDPSSVQLLAVAKRHPVEVIMAAYRAGQREFGENYVQELVEKAEALSSVADLRFRFIGHLQRNKAKEVARIGCAVDTIDSIRIADALDKQAATRGVTLEVLLQVNVDAEPQKAGVLPVDARALAEHVQGLSALTLRGVMAIPRAVEHPEQARPAFRTLAALARELELPVVSMGMSDDLDVAVEEGSTMVRVGTAIFGPRPR